MLVQLVSENDRLVVTDVHLIDPSLTGGRLEFISALRSWITARESRPMKRTPVVTVAAPATPALANPLAAVTPAVEPPAAASAPQPPAVSPATPAAPTPAANLPLLNQPIQIPGA